jgi:hypothetical protein
MACGLDQFSILDWHENTLYLIFLVQKGSIDSRSPYAKAIKPNDCNQISGGIIKFEIVAWLSCARIVVNHCSPERYAMDNEWNRFSYSQRPSW